MIKLPGKYKSILNTKETEHAIVAIKDFFQLALSTELNLTRVTAPLFVGSGTGINDDLIATGGTLAAAKNLIEMGGGEVTDFFGVIGLPFLNYEKVLAPCKVTTLLNYEGE